uniref:Uncharacterized protein n=1 Tax=Amphimedon queenslandica TaxID=400682 RepID=A0A1X7U9T4_AMPQE
MAESTSPAITMTCEVCSEYYTDPIMLPCLHSFCKKCLIKAKEKQGGTGTSLKCPTCDTSVNLPDGKIEGLTQNLWLEHKSKEALIKKKISSKEAISCDKCNVDDSSDAAVVYCCDCGQFLCDYCKKGHKRSRKEANHKLINLETKKSIELPAIKHEAVYCARHLDQKLTYYCNDCNRLVCQICLNVKHKSHNYNDYLDEGDTARKALKESVASCDGVIPPVTEAIANGEKMLEQIATPSRDYTTLTNQRSFDVGSGTSGVAVHTNGEVFASSNDGFVQVFSEDGTAVRRIGSKGNGNGQFDRPWGLLLVGDRLYVSDNNLHRVQYFSATTGQYIGQFGSNGNGNGQFSSPRGMSTDGKGNILVADISNKRVQVFKEDGTFVQVTECDGII